MKTVGTCFLCARAIEFGTGRTQISATGIVRSFCGSKCLTNHRLGRIPRKIKWIRKTQKEKITHDDETAREE